MYEAFRTGINAEKFFSGYVRRNVTFVFYKKLIVWRPSNTFGKMNGAAKSYFAMVNPTAKVFAFYSNGILQ